MDCEHLVFTGIMMLASGIMGYMIYYLFGDWH